MSLYPLSFVFIRVSSVFNPWLELLLSPLGRRLGIAAEAVVVALEGPVRVESAAAFAARHDPGVAGPVHQRQPDPVRRQETADDDLVLLVRLESQEILVPRQRLHGADQKAAEEVAGEQADHAA